MAEFNMDKFAQKVADRAMEVECNGKTLREWLDLLAGGEFKPVVRGKWIDNRYGTTICSICKRPRRDVRIGHTNYCNSCGADMRGDTDEASD